MPLKPAKHAAVRPAAQEAARRGAVGAPVSLRSPRRGPAGDQKARRAPAFIPGVRSASPGKAISHTPLEDARASS
jgi:hypothetical protein